MPAIFTFALIGFLLLAGEVFIPGMVLGTLGFIALVVAVWTGYATYGPVIGTWILAAVGASYSIGLILWLKVFPHTGIGRRISNRVALPSSWTVERHLVGARGAALSMLRPAGVALIEGQRKDVLTDGSFIDPGTPVVVIAEDGQKLVVRALLPHEIPDLNPNPNLNPP